MANLESRNDADPWVDQRLAALVPDRQWTPDPGNTLVRLRERNRAKLRAQAVAARRWFWTTVAAGGAGLALLLFPASRACAEQPGRCMQRVLHVAAADAVPAPVTPENRSVIQPIIPAPALNYKASGAPSAPVSLEIYLDYAGGNCENFVRDVVPLLTAQYINAGKVKLLYRDYPLPAHRYAKLAALYADAAGELGYYEAAMNQLFPTRAVWSVSGDPGTPLAQVLPSEVMEKLREHIRNGAGPDAVMASDFAAGQADHLEHNAFVVMVSRGKRQTITASPLTFEALKASLDPQFRN